MKYEFINTSVFNGLVVKELKDDIEYIIISDVKEKSNRITDFAVKEPDSKNKYVNCDGIGVDTSSNKAVAINTDVLTNTNTYTAKQQQSIADSTKKSDVTKTDSIIQRADTDGAWKRALEILFYEFLQLFVPDVHILIDTGIEPESKETELNELLVNSENIKRIVDKLVKVKLKNGDNVYLLIHIEVQSQVKTYKQQLQFAARMYEYHKLLSSKFTEHNHINIGVLINSTGAAVNINSIDKSTDKAKIDSLESTKHQNLDYLIYKIQNVLQQETTYKFPVVHLAKWLEHKDDLKVLAHSNPFAIIVLYQLVALKHPIKKTRNNAKIELITLTRKYNYTNKLLRELIYLIDMMIVLPESLNIEFYNEVKAMGTEVQERFVSIFERMGIRKGLEKGLVDGKIDMFLSMLRYKFNAVPTEIVELIKSANIEQLEAWSLKIFNAQTINDVFDK